MAHIVNYFPGVHRNVMARDNSPVFKVPPHYQTKNDGIPWDKRSRPVSICESAIPRMYSMHSTGMDEKGQHRLSYVSSPKERSLSGILDWKTSDNFLRPHSTVSQSHLLQDSRPISPRLSSQSVNFAPHHGVSMVPRRSNFNKFADTSSLTSYTRALSTDTKYVSGSKYSRGSTAYERASYMEKIPKLKPPELTGWRAKLAKEGYMASTTKATPPLPLHRQWHYVDEKDESVLEENFKYVHCQNTQTQTADYDPDSEDSKRTVSRNRKMKLEIQKMTSVKVETRDSEIQTNEEDLKFHEELSKRAKRSFISSRPCSWYQEGSYNKYVSAVPWRPTAYTSTRLSRKSDCLGPKYITRQDSAQPESTSNMMSNHKEQLNSEKELEVNNKNFRKSTLNMNFPESSQSNVLESQQRPEELVLPSDTDMLQHILLTRVESRAASSVGDGSLLETGYDSPCTEIGNLSIASSRAPSTEARSPLEDALFRFRSINSNSSQRDSGFSELYNSCDSPYDNVSHSSPAESTASSQNGQKDISTYVSTCEDIDSILLGIGFDKEEPISFEDYERHLGKDEERCNSFNEVKPKWNKPALAGLKLELNRYFIGLCRDIDDMLGKPDDLSPENCTPSDGLSTSTTTPTSVLGTLDVENVTLVEETDSIEDIFQGNCPASTTNELDDCTLQLYRYNGTEADYGHYLDLDSTVDEQAEEFDGFHNNRKNAVILRTQLSVRVHAIIEKLVNSTGRELRRALFSLKQIFQDDKDLVHEFVQNDGLSCLIKVGSEADQNYQNYILRALGQVMLYVDGMNGVIEHNETIQWLYSLIASKYRLVVKTALKLLLVFVEYTESNCQLLINAVCLTDSEHGAPPWSNIMNLLKEKDTADMELLVYAATLINKTLNGIPDQDTYYDLVDNLEEQGMESVIQYYMSKQGTDLDLLQQFQIYEAVLKHEDGVPDNKPLPLDARLRQVPRSRKSHPCDLDRRKSRRHSVGTLPTPTHKKFNRSLEKTPEESPFIWQDRKFRKSEECLTNGNIKMSPVHMNGNGEYLDLDENGITPALRRRRERDARNRSLIKEQEQSRKENSTYQNVESLSSASSICSDSCESPTLVTDDISSLLAKRYQSRFQNNNKSETNGICDTGQKVRDSRSPESDSMPYTKSSDAQRPNCLPYARSDTKKAWMFSMMYGKSQDEETKCPQDQLNKSVSPVEIVNNAYINSYKIDEETKFNLKKDGSIKDIQEKFNYRYENGSCSPNDNLNRLGDASGIISRAKEGLAASSARPEPRVTSPADSPSRIVMDPKKLETDLQWEQLMMSMKRPLHINGLDFTDLREEDDEDFLPNGDSERENSHEPTPPPQPPGIMGVPPPPPPLPLGGGPVPPPPPPQFPSQLNSRIATLNGSVLPPPPWIKRNQHQTQDLLKDQSTLKTKKTVKLFWKEVKEDRSLLQRIGKKKTIWDELKPIPVDTQKLEHLFENRAKDVMNKEKTQESSKKSEIIVLDTKRSNAINIGMTKLPPPRTIKTAILKMDSTIMNREGIEKILTTMLPTEDEKSRIAEAQMSNPDVPLGTAEQFLLTLSSISELEARLRLWAFRLDYESIEREVAEPLMDLKQAMKEIETSDTFRVILSTLRSIGNFLNGVEIKGFHIEYLSKVPEVKDTVQKHSLLHHLCHIVMEKFPKSSDLYSEIGSVTRSSKVDYAEVSKNLNKLENECKASWDYLKAIAKHDCNITMKVRVSEFLTDCAERIIVLKVIHRRMSNRYHKFLVYLGCPSQSIDEMPIQRVCKVLSEFALEYRTTRERVLQQIEKKANHRERNKTRGKMITEMERFKTKEQQADHELKQLLVNSCDLKSQKWGTVPGMRSRVKSVPGPGGSLGRHSAPGKEEEGEDEILETLVKTATTQPIRNSEPRIRKKARYGDRKSLRRTLKNGLSEEERRALTTMAT